MNGFPGEVHMEGTVKSWHYEKKYIQEMTQWCHCVYGISRAQWYMGVMDRETGKVGRDRLGGGGQDWGFIVKAKVLIFFLNIYILLK